MVHDLIDKFNRLNSVVELDMSNQLQSIVFLDHFQFSSVIIPVIPVTLIRHKQRRAAACVFQTMMVILIETAGLKFRQSVHRGVIISDLHLLGMRRKMQQPGRFSLFQSQI